MPISPVSAPMPPILGMFDTPEVLAPDCNFNFEWWGALPGAMGSADPWTQTSVGASNVAAIAVYADRPCYTYVSATAGATDGLQAQFGTANYTFEAGKPVILKGAFNLADPANQNFLFGLGTVDTTLIASAPTDFIGIANTAGVLTLRRDVGSTVENISTTLTLTANTWFDVAIVLTPDSTTSGAGKIELYAKISAAGMDGMTQLSSHSFGTLFPTNALALSWAYNNGTTADAAFRIQYVGMRVKR